MVAASDHDPSSRGAIQADWAAATRRARRLGRVQTGVLVALCVAMAAMALVGGGALIGSLGDYRAEQARQAKLDGMRFDLQEQEAVFWRHRLDGGRGVPAESAATLLAVTAGAHALGSSELEGDATPGERRAVRDTLDWLDAMVAMIAAAGDTGAVGSEPDARFIERLEPMIAGVKEAVDRWRTENVEELAAANAEVTAATRRIAVMVGAAAVLALLGGLLTARLVGRARGRIVDELEGAHERLRLQADTDPLTGLGNQRLLHHRLRQLVGEGGVLSAVMVDLDHFKAVNDTHGHSAGDRVLVETGARLREGLRPGDCVARIGGEEFLLLLPGTDGEAALAVAQRIRRSIRGREFPRGVGRLTASLGVATLGPGMDADALIEEADTALYWAKTHGRDAAFRFSADLMAGLSTHSRARQLARADGLAALRALARAIDAKDPATQQHSVRVGDMAVMLATSLGWTPEQAARLREAGLVHDVGKIGIPDAVLLKQSGLTDDERRQMQEHAALGSRIGSEVLDPDQVEWVAHHHEWWDGGGYPAGLGGTDIPEGARILALADAWDAMTSARGYNDPRGAREALRECVRSAGTHFWPPAVEALRRLDGAGLLAAELAPPPLAIAG